MIDEAGSNSQPEYTEAYLEEMAILQRKIARQEKAIFQIAKKLGVQLSD